MVIDFEWTQRYFGIRLQTFYFYRVLNNFIKYSLIHLMYIASHNCQRTTFQKLKLLKI